MTTIYSKVDGRNARAERTRAAVATALLKLIHNGHLRPTAAQVAGEAGVSLRSVFQHFDDMESLYAAVADAQMERFAHLLSQGQADGSLPQRIQAFVERRSNVLEAISPVRRAALLQEPFSEVLAERLRRAHDMARGDIERTFAPELERASAKARQVLLDALDVATSWSAWDTSRRQNGLTHEDSEQVMKRMIEALLKEVV
jgi:AcrR family transcriptional regulator